MAYINPNMTNVITTGTGGAMGFGSGVTLNNIAYPNNSSDNPDDWDNEEKVRFFLWFMKMHHEEDIKGFKAMRDIERSVERAEREEMQRKQWELQEQLYAMQQSQAQQQSYANVFKTQALSTTPTKESWWKKALSKI
jgi:hypothetical protein